MLDSLIYLPLMGLFFWGQGQSRLFPLYFFPPNAIFILFYDVYLVRRFGGTPGKLLAGVRIRKIDGSPIGYREALLRFLPEFVFMVLGNVALIDAAFGITDSEYLSWSFFERQQQLTQFGPSWNQTINIANQIWIWSEFIVLLTNRKRRALHDFIAGTIVVLQKPVPAPEPAVVTLPG